MSKVHDDDDDDDDGDGNDDNGDDHDGDGIEEEVQIRKKGLLSALCSHTVNLVAGGS